MKPKNNNKGHNKTEMLNEIENEQLFNKLLNPKCQALSTSVVQLFAASEDTDMQWIKQDAGVLCFERDVNWRSYFFRLYCLIRNEMIWEHEIYENMQYLVSKPFLHTFEAEGCIVAFNFTDNEEAEHMKEIVLEKLKGKRDQKNEIAKSTWYHDNRSSKLTEPEPALIPEDKSQSKWTLTSLRNSIIGKKSRNRADKNSKKNKCKTIEIGCPENVRHISGYNNMLEKMKEVDGKFLKQAGISEDLLKDPKTVEFIAHFIEKHEAWEVLKINPKSSSQDTSPLHLLPDYHAPPSTNLQPPPLPPRNKPSSGANVKLTHPTPLPPPSSPPPKDVLVSGKNAWSVQKPLRKNITASNNNVPPPPPPPPPAAAPHEENFFNTVPSSVTTSNDPQSALMAAIRGGTTLKPVVRDAAKVNNPRGDLLDQIKQGVQLKQVQPVERSAHSSGTLSQDGLAAALRRALNKRFEAIHSSSNSGNSNSEDDDSDNERW